MCERNALTLRPTGPSYGSNHALGNLASLATSPADWVLIAVQLLQGGLLFFPDMAQVQADVAASSDGEKENVTALVIELFELAAPPVCLHAPHCAPPGLAAQLGTSTESRAELRVVLRTTTFTFASSRS